MAMCRPQGSRRGTPRALTLALLGGAAYLFGDSLSFASGPGRGKHAAVAHFAGQASIGYRSQLARASHIGQQAAKKAAAAFAEGDVVTAIFPDDGQWYAGTIDKANTDGSFSVKWDNPDGGPETSDVQPESIKKVVIYSDYKVGEAVQAVFPDDGVMYGATVSKINKDGTFQVKWDDAGDGPAESAVAAKDMKYPPIPFDKLEVGQKYTGKVRSVLDFGAFVDIGAEGDGLLHISRISKDRVENIHDYVQEGQEIECWISGLREGGKYGVTMVEGLREGAGGGRGAPKDLAPFADLSPTEWQSGVVARIAPFGAFVTVTVGDASADGLVHVSQIRDGFVDNVQAELSEGQEVKVRVQSVDLATGKMSLSMREGGGGGGGGSRGPSDLSAFQNVSPDTWLTGKVARCASFGAFVTVEHDGATADGLVHITAIKDGFVESVEAELSVGQEVQVRVQSVDMGAGKMSLSMKSA